MKIAVTDACIFIDIIELRLTTQFFKLQLEVHTSLDVYNELYENQKAVLDAYQAVGILIIHNISSEDRLEMLNTTYPKALSDNDKTVIFLAKKLQALILSSDKPVRNYAKANAIEYHGMLWIFDQLVELKLILKKEAIMLLKSLVNSNIVYQNNKELVSEMTKRLKYWSI